MSTQAANLHRRTFLKTAVSAGAAIIAAPHIIPSSALGKDGAVAPSERIVLGRHRHRQPGNLRPRLLPRTRRRSVRRGLRCESEPPQRGEADRRPEVRQPRLQNVSRLPRTAWTAKISTPC